MRTALALLCLGVLMPAAAFAGFDPAAMRQKYVVGTTYHTMGFTGAQLRNVDGQGDELLIGYTNMWQLLRWNGAASDFVQVGFFENSYGNVFGGGGLQSVRFAEFDPHVTEIAVLGEDGNIGRFGLDGTPHGAFWKPAAQGVTRMLMGNLDDQPGDELVLVSCTEVTAWKFGAGAPLWRIPLKECQPVRLAQLDTDPQLELVLGSGTIIDTKTLQTQWRYPIGFGAVLTTGDVNGDGVPDLIGCTDRQCDAFDVVHQTTLWETFLDYPYGVGALAAADVDGDGKAEIFEGDGQHGYIRKIDGATGAILQQFSKTGGANFVLIGDLNGDCNKEVIWAKDGDSTGLDTFHVTDAVTMKTFWSSVPEEHGSSGVAVADFSGTGHPSVLWTSQGGTIERFVSFSPPGRAYRERFELGDTYALYLSVSAAAQLDSDPAVEYILPTQFLDGGDGFSVYDGATHQLQWSLPVMPIGDTLSSITTSDLNGDGVPDILVAYSIVYFPKSHPEAVVAVDGATHKILWRTTDALSHLLDEDCFGCITEVKAADLDLKGTKTVLALVPSDGLYAFNSHDGTLLWHSLLEGPDDPTEIKAVAFAVADVDPSPGAEILVPLADARLAIFDSGGKFLRAKDLSKYGRGLAVETADLDGDGVLEIVVVTQSGLVILSSRTLEVLWSGGFVLTGYSFGNQLVIADVDGDSTPEILVPSAHSLRVFEYRAKRIDSAPPSFGSATLQTVAPTGCCRVELQWGAAADAASMPVTYRIYRSLTPGFTPAPSLRIAESASNSFVDRELLAGHAYYYAVTAVDSAGNESAEALRTSAVAPSGCPSRRRAATP